MKKLLLLFLLLFSLNIIAQDSITCMLRYKPLVKDELFCDGLITTGLGIILTSFTIVGNIDRNALYITVPLMPLGITVDIIAFIKKRKREKINYFSFNYNRL